MNTELIWTSYENVDTNHVAERLFRGRVFQSSIIGIKLRDISSGTMTISDILENFPSIRSLVVHRGVSSETLGDLRHSRNIVSLQVTDTLLPELDGVSHHVSFLDIMMTRPHSSEKFGGMIIKLLKMHPGHVTLKIDDRAFLTDGDLYTVLGELNVSIVFYKT